LLSILLQILFQFQLALLHLGYRVCLVDADIGLRNLDLLLVGPPDRTLLATSSNARFTNKPRLVEFDGIL